MQFQPNRSTFTLAIVLLSTNSNILTHGQSSYCTAKLLFFLLTSDQHEAENLGPALWQYGLWSFQTGYTKLERFLQVSEAPH